MKNLLYFVLFALVAGAVYYFVTLDNSGSLMEKDLTDFAITDTSAIGKVVIDDGRNIVELKRTDNRFWTVNETYTAMPHHIDVIMQTFTNVGIQNPVPKSQKATAMRIIMGDTRKVQIYDRAGTWLKTWYVGRATQSNQGTYAFLETPEEGVSTEPYIIEMRGFRGYLTTRFHAAIADWRWTGLFYYPELDFKKVEVKTPRVPELGFTIKVKNKLEGDFEVLDYEGKPTTFNKANVAAYLGGYKSINVEHFEPPITVAQEDSLRATPPAFTITVTAKDDQEQSADIWYRKISESLAYKMGDAAPEEDPERVYVYFNDDLAIGQRLSFDKLLLTRADL